MDFDKIKKAAKDTIKIVSNKVDEKLSRSDDDEMFEVKSAKTVYDDIDDFTEADDDFMGETRRFDMKDALNRFRKRQDDIEDALSDVIKTKDNKPADDKAVSEFIESNISDLKKNISESISDIDEDISNLSTNYSQEMKKINSDIQDLRQYIDKVSEMTQKTDSSINTLSENLEGSILDINKKLNEISSSISGVNRINDSIFDLKNTQMNTKNFLGDLEASFNALKRKMTAGVTILSVITAIIAVLEILNLLSW